MPRRAPALRASLAALFLLVGLSACENWPLFAHLPSPEEERPPVVATGVVEDAALSADEVQLFGSVASAARFLISGSAESCGFDPAGEGPEWPAHPVDSDGDGLAEASRSIQGWYSGDVDHFGFSTEVGLRISFELTWENAPAGDGNSPYRPDDETAAWASESDLDLFVYALAEEGFVPTVSHDEAAGRSYPERVPGSLVAPAGSSVVFGIGCHHGLATDYELELTATPL